MTMIPYNVGIPASSHNPSNDQPLMQANNDANNTIWDVDHYQFNENFSGMHTQSTYIDQISNPGSLASSLRLYSKADSSSVSQLYFQRDANSAVVQMTGIVPIVGNTVMIGNLTYVSSETFLAGPLIIKTGSITNAGVAPFAVSVTFAALGLTNFPTVATTLVGQANGGISAGFFNSVTLTGFSFNMSSGSGTVMSWIAIGY